MDEREMWQRRMRKAEHEVHTDKYVKLHKVVVCKLKHVSLYLMIKKKNSRF